VARADRDTLTTRESYYKLYFDFVEHKSDVLVGTQMIAKGMDFPNVAVVGIVAADVALNLPDFRRSERTFQLMVQASGRTGRGERPGFVFVQTYDPEHFAIATASTHSYDAFYRQEIEYRQELGYPPFGSLWLLEVSDLDNRKAQENIGKVADMLKPLTNEGCEVLGPAPAAMPKLREHYRYHVLVKGPESAAVTRALAALPTAELGCSITVDPYYML
jgi:primosomal protein N' (replication factor Y)